MKSVRPLQEASDDLAYISSFTFERNTWDPSLVENALRCYRSWVDYAVRGEDVAVEVLFP